MEILLAKDIKNISSNIFRLSLDFIDSKNRLICQLIFIYSLFLLINNILEIFHIQAWRHDALMYYESYVGKLKGEGRWLNYFLFSLLQKVNPKCSILIEFISLFYFMYVCMSKVTGKWCAIALATAALQLAPFYALVYWPLTVMPSFVLLAISAYVHDKMNYVSFLMIFGILFGGCFNNFYNILPLLFLSKVNNFRQCAKFIVFWVVAFILGFLFANVMAKLFAGSFIVFESWRNPSPVKSFEVLLINIETSVMSFWSSIKRFGVFYCFLITFFSIVLIFIANNKTRAVLNMIIILLVMLSGYMQMIPYGFEVYSRTDFNFFVSLFIVIAIIASWKKYMLLIIPCLCFSLYAKNIDMLRTYNIVVGVWYDNLKIIQVDPRIYTLVMLSNHQAAVSMEKFIMDQSQRKFNFGEGLGCVARWVSVAREMGFKRVIYGEGAEKIFEHAQIESKILFSTNSVYKYALYRNFLFLKFRDDLG